MIVECDACEKSKIKRQIRQASRDLYKGLGHRLTIDFHDFNLNQ